MKKIQKCTYGYLHSRKIKTLIGMISGFSLVLLLFFSGIIITGERKNLLTLAAVLCCLPTAKVTVAFLMYPWKSKAKLEEYNELLTIAGNVIPVFSDIIITPEKKSIEITYGFCTKNMVVFLCNDKKLDKNYHADFVKKFLNASDYQCTVMFYDDYYKFKKKLELLQKNEPSEYNEEELDKIAGMAYTVSLMSL